MMQATFRPSPWWPLLEFLPLLWVLGLAVVWIRRGCVSAGKLGFQRSGIPTTSGLAIIGVGWLALYGMALLWYLVSPVPETASVLRNLLHDMRLVNLPIAPVYLGAWAVLVAVAEEILFRGVIYGALRQHLSVGVALPVESLVFALRTYPKTPARRQQMIAQANWRSAA
jgi:membrane protease YdiL (CAAX protease family)